MLFLDPALKEKSGTVCVAAQLARDFGIQDIDGTQPRPLTIDSVLKSDPGNYLILSVKRSKCLGDCVCNFASVGSLGPGSLKLAGFFIKKPIFDPFNIKKVSMFVHFWPGQPNQSSFMIRALLFVILIVQSVSAQAQETKENVKTVARPNIPGSFIVDFGFNQPIQEPQDFVLDFWGSRTVNLYYQYSIRLGRSHFSINPAIGMSLERFKFKNDYMLYDPDEISSSLRVEHYTMVPSSNFYPEVKKVMLIANYLEMPLELRFDTKPEDIARSFNIALGGRIGILFDSDQKVKYREDEQWKKAKNKEDWGLSFLRYGVYTRIGIGGFNFFGFYNLSPLFEPNMGPGNTTMNTYTFGISVNGF